MLWRGVLAQAVQTIRLVAPGARRHAGEQKRLIAVDAHVGDFRIAHGQSRDRYRRLQFLLQPFTDFQHRRQGP